MTQQVVKGSLRRVLASGCDAASCERQLQEGWAADVTTTSRRMLRKMIATPRRYLKKDESISEQEDWTDWIVKATRIAEREQKKAGLDTWVESQRKRKDRLWQKLHEDADERWATKILHWSPEGLRRVGRPVSRWTDLR